MVGNINTLPTLQEMVGNINTLPTLQEMVGNIKTLPTLQEMVGNIKTLPTLHKNNDRTANSLILGCQPFQLTFKGLGNGLGFLVAVNHVRNDHNDQFGTLA